MHHHHDLMDEDRLTEPDPRCEENGGLGNIPHDRDPMPDGGARFERREDTLRAGRLILIPAHSRCGGKSAGGEAADQTHPTERDRQPAIPAQGAPAGIVMPQTLRKPVDPIVTHGSTLIR